MNRDRARSRQRANLTGRCLRCAGQAAGLALAALLGLTFRPAAARANNPNIVLIITDDQRFDELRPFMPNTTAKIFESGIEFQKGYVTTPLCCPSRSSIFTGLYASRHGVLTNHDHLTRTTIFNVLKGKYFQGLVGKYLNSWNGDPRPEFDFWAAFPGGLVKYENPPIKTAGVTRRHSGYVTDSLTAYALDFLEKARSVERPFFLTVAYNAPHLPSDPSAAKIGSFDFVPAVLPLTFNLGFDRKPPWIQRLAPISFGTAKRLLNDLKKRRECLASVDDSINSIMTALEQSGKLSDTIIFFLSDNGYMFGEHKLLEKGVAYEEAVRVPFAVRYDAMVQARVSSALVANIDITPTILDLTSEKLPYTPDGTSLMPLFSADLKLHESIMLEGAGRHVRLLSRANAESKAPFKAVHDGRFVLIKTPGRDRNAPYWELYDLENDPMQLENLATEPAYASERARLEGKFKKR